MARKKTHYAVRKGKVPGVYLTWEECQKQIIGFPSAEFKGFYSQGDADAYLSGSEEASPSQAETHIITPESEDHAIAYVDGSFEASVGRYGYGVVLISAPEQIHKVNGWGDDPDKVAARNVTGEIIGATTAMQLAVEGGFRKLTICYDYEGIKKWATGEWRAKQDLTQQYAADAAEYKRSIDIDFIHVAAHTGIKYNEEADALAKQAIADSVGNEGP